MPFAEFDPFSGRIKESKRLQPLYPILPNPLDKAEAPNIMFDLSTTRAAKVKSESLSTASSGQPNPRHFLWERFLKKRALLQAADPNIPMYLRLGLRDRILFGITVFGIGVCMVESLQFCYVLTQTKDK